MRTPTRPDEPSQHATGRRAPAVLVVLVVKDGEAWLRECLRGLSQQTYPRLGVIAVDNGSVDASRELLVRALGEERVLSRPDNPGLPGAVQSALALEAAAGADYVLIHHDDVALDPDAITRMVEVAERIEAVGVVGPKVVDWDDPRVLREVGLSTDRFGYPYSPLEQDEIDQGQYDRVREVLFVSSAAMLVSKGALDRAGPPDERLSSFHEDLDFCWRVRLAGFRVVMTPQARARHRGATGRGERPAIRGHDRARYFAERAGLAAMLKNYGLISLLWVLPLYAMQGIAKLVLWAVSRRFDDVWQVLAAWGWNLLHLPGTIRRRVRAQSVRTVPDRSVRRYMAPATVRLRRWSDLASRAVLQADQAATATEHQPIDEMDELVEPPPLTRRALAFARAHPVATAWALVVVVGVFAYRHLWGSGDLTGGALATPPGAPSDYFRELLSSVRTTALGGAQPGSPALGFLGVLSAVLAASTAVAQKALLFMLPVAAAFGFYRAFVRETGERGPAVVGAACYGLSSTLLWALSQGRIAVLVMLAVAPVLAGRLDVGFTSQRVRPLRFLAASGIVLAAGVAFFPGTALVFALLLLAWLAVPRSGERRVRGLGFALGGAAVAGLLVFPQAVDLAAGAGHGLATAGARPSFFSLLRLVPDGGTGSWSVSWFLPIAAILAFTLVEGALRSAERYLLVAVAAVFLAWASAAGYLPHAISNPPAYLAAAALAYSALVVYGLASVLPRMGQYAFGFRQLAVVVVVGLLVGGIGLQAAVAAKGSWEIGKDKLPAAWTLVSTTSASRNYRVLWLGRLSGDPFPPPGGDPVGTIRVGDVSLRWALTGRNGITALDVGRDERGPGYAYLERALAEIVSGDTTHGGALLAPLGIAFIVAASGDLPSVARRKIARQVDIDVVPTQGLSIFQNSRALPEAAFVAQQQYVKPQLQTLAQAASLPPPGVTTIHPVKSGFRGTATHAGAVLLGDQFASGWRLRSAGKTSSPDRLFGWSMRFPVDSAGPVTLEHPSETARRLEVALIAILWLAALWVTRRPSRA